MINNYFLGEEYHSADEIYFHPTYRHSLLLGDMAAALDLELLSTLNVRTGTCGITQ
jgi:hypothetical protein